MSMNGTKVLLKLGTASSEAALTGETSHSLDMAIDMIETTVKASSERSKTYEAGENGLTGSVEAKIATSDGATIVALTTAAKLGTPQSCIISSEVAGDFEITGNVLISGVSLGSPQNDVRTVTFNIQFTGTYDFTVIAA